MNPINLMHLKFFCDAVTYGSISESAKKNYVTQSTVSQGISKLEKVLGVELLTHAKQKFCPTEEGRIVFEQAPQVFKAIQNIHEHINNAKAEITGNIRFVSTNSLGISFLAPLFREMQIHYPGVNMNFQLGNLNFIRTALRQGGADFAIVVYDESFSQFEKHLLRKGAFQLYQHEDAPLYSLAEGILVDNALGMHVEALQKHCSEILDNPLPLKAELAGWEVVARFTAANIGVGFFPDYLVGEERYPQLKVHGLEIPPLEYEICAIYNKGEKLSRAAEALFNLFTVPQS